MFKCGEGRPLGTDPMGTENGIPSMRTILTVSALLARTVPKQISFEQKLSEIL